MSITKKRAPKLVFFNEKKIRKIRIVIITALNDTVCFSVYIGPEKRPNIPYKVVDEGNGRFRIEFTTVIFYFSKKEKMNK